MLQTDTAYPIALTNANVLHHISGKPLKELLANVGWCATYSIYRYPRWMIVPRTSAIHDMGFPIDEETYP